MRHYKLIAWFTTLFVLISVGFTQQTGRLKLENLAQTSATTGQAIAWNGTTWTPQSLNTLGGVVYNGSQSLSAAQQLQARKNLNAAQVFDVRHYGALCDGSTDDLTSFNAAITAAAVSGGVVSAPPGVCMVSGPVAINVDNVAVVGQGLSEGTSPQTGTVIRARTGFVGSAVLRVVRLAADRPIAYFRLENITIDGNSKLNSGNTTGSITTGTASLTVASATGFSVGQDVTVAGAGAASGQLLARISSISSNVLTLNTNASTTVSGAATLGLVDAADIRAYRARILNAAFQQASGNGLHQRGYTTANGDSVTWSIYDSIVQNTYESNNGLSGILAENNATDGVWAFTHSFANARDGMEFNNVSASNVYGGHLYGNARHGITVIGGMNYGAFQNLEIETSGQGGFYGLADANSGMSSGLIQNNRFFGNSQTTTNTYDELQLSDAGGANKGHYEIRIDGNTFIGATNSKASKYGLNLGGNVQKGEIANNTFSAGSFGTSACNGTGSGSSGLEPTFTSNRGCTVYGVSAYTPQLDATLLTARRIYQFPDIAGTFALTNQVIRYDASQSLNTTQQAQARTNQGLQSFTLDPRWYGAVSGTGVSGVIATANTTAINTALTDSVTLKRAVLIDQDYTVGGTIIAPTGALLNYGGGRLIPNGDFTVLEIDLGTNFTTASAYVDASAQATYTSRAVRVIGSPNANAPYGKLFIPFLYVKGIEAFTASGSIGLSIESGTGTASNVSGEYFGQVFTSFFDIGIQMKTTAAGGWVNGNRFSSVLSDDSRYGLDLWDSINSTSEVSGNQFGTYQFQTKTSGNQSLRSIRLRGGQTTANQFPSAFTWDFTSAANTAAYVNETTQPNGIRNFINDSGNNATRFSMRQGDQFTSSETLQSSGYDFIIQNPASITYYLLGTLPVSSGSTHDILEIAHTGGDYTAALRQDTFAFTNRGSFRYVWQANPITGSTRSNLAVVAYTDTGVTNVYLKAAVGVFVNGLLRVNNHDTTVTNVANKTLPTGTTTTPTGTLVFDSSNQTTYPPVNQTNISSAGVIFTGSQGLTQVQQTQAQTNAGINAATSVAFSASITPTFGGSGNVQVIGTLTGNTTINNPTAVPAAGTRVAFVFTQDATGNRTVAWGTNYINGRTISGTASGTSVVEFISDGTNLKGVDNNIPLPSYLQANLPTTCTNGEMAYSTNHFGDSNGRIVRCVPTNTWRIVFDGADVAGGSSTSTPSGTVNDYSPTNISFVFTMKIAPTASTVITGIVPVSDGVERNFINTSTSRVIVLAQQNTGSAAANRLELGGQNIILYPNDSIRMIYDTTISRWRVIAYQSIYGQIVNNNFKSQTPGSGTAPQGNLIHTSNGGTISHVSTTDTNYHTRQYRIRGATGATAGTPSGTRTAIALTTRNQGFLAKFRWGYSLQSANGSSFIGLIASTAVISNADPSTQLSLVGFGYNSAVTTLGFYGNDATGAATVTTVGATNYTTNTTSWYDGTIFSTPGGSIITLIVWRADDSTLTPVVLDVTAAGDLPAATALLSPHIWVSNRADASDNQIEWNYMSLLTP